MSARSHLDEFTRAERMRTYKNNSVLLQQQFPAVTVFKTIPHYICESCHFVSKSRSNFNIDHVNPVAQGGSRNRVTKDVNVQLRNAQKPGATDAEIDQAIQLLLRVGNNAAVLCTECNSQKSDLLFVPDDCGLAYTRHVDDLNPTHQQDGPPKPHPRW
jgi:5-methylcytosine-specific restriction endonuclease McrA